MPFWLFGCGDTLCWRPCFWNKPESDQCNCSETEHDKVGESQRPARPLSETAGNERADTEGSDADRRADRSGPDNRRSGLGAKAQLDQIRDRCPGSEPCSD